MISIELNGVKYTKVKFINKSNGKKFYTLEGTTKPKANGVFTTKYTVLTGRTIQKDTRTKSKS